MNDIPVEAESAFVNFWSGAGPWIAGGHAEAEDVAYEAFRAGWQAATVTGMSEQPDAVKDFLGWFRGVLENHPPVTAAELDVFAEEAERRLDAQPEIAAAFGITAGSC